MWLYSLKTIVLFFLMWQLIVDELYTEHTIRDLSDCLSSSSKAYHCLPCAVMCKLQLNSSDVTLACGPVCIQLYLFDIQILIIALFLYFHDANKLFFSTLLFSLGFFHELCQICVHCTSKKYRKVLISAEQKTTNVRL